MYLFLSILMLSCAQFGSQVFLPALPQIAEQFALSNTDAQQIIMLYAIGFGLSQLLYGPWSDVAGRRKVFLFGQLLFIGGSLCCAMATSPTMLAIGRILQGLGAGAPLIVSRTILGDLLIGDKLKQAFASMAIAASVITVFSPLLGGWLATNAGWQYLFGFVSLYLALTWVIGFKLLPAGSGARGSVSVLKILKEYSSLIFDARFLCPASFKWLPNLLFMCTVTFFPFEFQQKFSLSAEQYGFYISITMGGLVLGTVLVKMLQKHWGYHSILALFWPLLLLSSLCFYLLPFTLFNALLSYSLFLICGGAFYTCCLQLIIEPFRQQAGTVNALSGAIDMFGCALLAMLINKYWIVDSQSLGMLFLLVTGSLAVSWWLMYRQIKRGPKRPRNPVFNPKQCARVESDI